VVSVRGVETRSETNSREELEERQVVPVTLALRPKDALAVTYADSFADSVRLVGLPPGANGKNRSGEDTHVDRRDLDLPKALG
jgi:pilus assembly protein CpaB